MLAPGTHLAARRARAKRDVGSRAERRDSKRDRRELSRPVRRDRPIEHLPRRLRRRRHRRHCRRRPSLSPFCRRSPLESRRTDRRQNTCWPRDREKEGSRTPRRHGKKSIFGHFNRVEGTRHLTGTRRTNKRAFGRVDMDLIHWDWKKREVLN